MSSAASDHDSRWSGVALALGAAALFGVSVPVAKLLLGNGLDPLLLAGVLYLGSGLGLTLFRALRGVITAPAQEAPLRRADLPQLLLVIAAGGIAAPVLLMLGLAHTDAASASLLLNVEGLATLAIAWIVFRENAGTRIILGAGAILAGAVLVTWGGSATGTGWGALLVIAACIAWAIDNNLTRKLSAADPVSIAAWKGLAAGSVNFALALVRGAALPPPDVLAAAALLGFFGYGVSLVLFVLALRHLGVARTGAYYATAPFLGAALSVVLLGQPLTLTLLTAGALMVFGVWLHISEAHGHWHRHRPMEHEHRHGHDLHHVHGHGPDVPKDTTHSHAHRHLPAAHRHPHYPDLHHRHDHEQTPDETAESDQHPAGHRHRSS
jgi:drug/metabolite transporter (DMT)-like permease